MKTVASLKDILNEILKKQRSLIVTLPSNIEWADYEKELKKAENYENVLNFKVHSIPTGVHEGDRCYIVHKGFVIGWMEIVGFSKKEFTCSTTGRKWDGNFVERSGPFHYISEKIPYKGFQGYRYFDLEEYKQQKGIK